MSGPTPQQQRHRSSDCRSNRHTSCNPANVVCECSCHVPPLPPREAPPVAPVKPPRPRKPPGRKPRRYPPVRPPKEAAPCCVAKRDDLGRLPVGFCGPDCIRRPEKAL